MARLRVECCVSIAAGDVTRSVFRDLRRTLLRRGGRLDLEEQRRRAVAHAALDVADHVEGTGLRAHPVATNRTGAAYARPGVAASGAADRRSCALDSPASSVVRLAVRPAGRPSRHTSIGPSKPSYRSHSTMRRAEPPFDRFGCSG